MQTDRRADLELATNMTELVVLDQIIKTVLRLNGITDNETSDHDVGLDAHDIQAGLNDRGSDDQKSVMVEMGREGETADFSTHVGQFLRGESALRHGRCQPRCRRQHPSKLYNGVRVGRCELQIDLCTVERAAFGILALRVLGRQVRSCLVACTMRD